MMKPAYAPNARWLVGSLDTQPKKSAPVVTVMVTAPPKLNQWSCSAMGPGRLVGMVFDTLPSSSGSVKVSRLRYLSEYSLYSIAMCPGARVIRVDHW